MRRLENMNNSSVMGRMSATAIIRAAESRFLRNYVGRPYLSLMCRVWDRLPGFLTSWRPVRGYGVHLHHLIQLRAARKQSVGTFFLRNRPELQLLILLLSQKPNGSAVHMVVLGCSKGAEVYSVSYAIRCARPDLDLRLYAMDIDPDVLKFAKKGIYSLDDQEPPWSYVAANNNGNLIAGTVKDQNRSIFDRMSTDEMAAMFDRECGCVKVKPKFQEGITWHVGDAGDPNLVKSLKPHDIVVANRFLCHMKPREAEACLRNIGGLVKPKGYLLVSGVDLAVRARVASELGWKPVTELIREIHDGDPSLRRDWPLHYWGLEPFDQRRGDWRIRYASVFQI